MEYADSCLGKQKPNLLVKVLKATASLPVSDLVSAAQCSETLSLTI